MANWFGLGIRYYSSSDEIPGLCKHPNTLVACNTQHFALFHLEQSDVDTTLAKRLEQRMERFLSPERSAYLAASSCVGSKLTMA